LKNLLDCHQYCKENGVLIKPGVELELTGLSCGSHFEELNTSLEVI